jgi:hypothetical protein
MNIDKSSFVILVGTMAASGAGGWFARDKLVLRSEAVAPPAPAPPSAAPIVPEPKSAEPVKPLPPVVPICDDAEGATPDCTGFPDPGDEGCNLALPRCLQYRESFKPKPARAAIDCLKRLRGAQLCDPIMINKCGHEALMAACPGDDAVEQSCTTLLASCKGAIPGPTPADCKQTLSGMNETGRKKMAACLGKLCDARGLYGCEAR